MFLVSGLSACDGGDDASAGLPPNAVARIGEMLLLKRQMGVLMPSGSSEAVRRQAPERLILFEWLKREGRRRGLDLKHAEATMPAKDVKTAAAVSRATFAWLFVTLLRHRSESLPSDADLARYYRGHRQEFAFPEVRFMRLVATDSRARAVSAKRALDRGASWAAVIASHSTHRASSRPRSGELGVAPGETLPRLEKAIYSARTGVVSGPVKTDRGWVVFELTAIDSLPPQTLAQARDHIRTRLQASRQARAKMELTRRLLRIYRPITECASGLELQLCSDASAGGPAKASLLDL